MLNLIIFYKYEKYVKIRVYYKELDANKNNDIKSCLYVKSIRGS